jgi:hypothetical protein
MSELRLCLSNVIETWFSYSIRVCHLSTLRSTESGPFFHTYFLLYLDSLILFLFSCLSVFCPFNSALHLSIFLLLLIFPFLHWHTRSSGSIPLSPSSPLFFLSLHHFVSILHSSFPSILSSNFGVLFSSFTLSLFLLVFPHWRFSVYY